MLISRAFLYISFRASSKRSLPPGSPHRAPIEMFHFQSSHLSFTVPSKWAPSSRAPMERDACFQSLLLHISWSPPKNVLPIIQNLKRGPYGERCSVSRAYGLFIHSHLSQAPVKELTHEIVRRHMVTVHGAPHRWKAYIQWGAAWFPKGIIYSTAVTTPVPHSLQHNTFHLGLGRPQPR